MCLKSLYLYREVGAMFQQNLYSALVTVLDGEMQRRTAVCIHLVDVCALLQQQFDDRVKATHRSEMQRIDAGRGVEGRA